MAGYFSVNNNNEFSMSSVYFDAIVNNSKSYLEKASTKLTEEIYQPIEEAGMFVVGLTEASPEDFKLILNALKAGYDNCLVEGECGSLDKAFYSDVMSMWKEILTAMSQDRRSQ